MQNFFSRLTGNELARLTQINLSCPQRNYVYAPC